MFENISNLEGNLIEIEGLIGTLEIMDDYYVRNINNNNLELNAKYHLKEDLEKYQSLFYIVLEKMNKVKKSMKKDVYELYDKINNWKRRRENE